jgi:membrane protein implicated in regulation of membrane protease activity
MFSNYWWLWMAMAALFVIAEIFTAGFFILWFGIGAAVAGVMALCGLSSAWQWGAFVVVSGTLLPLSRRFAQAVTNEQPAGVGANRNIGKPGVVLQEIDNEAGTGQVKVDDDQWRARSSTGEKITQGTQIEVVSQEGTHLTVTVSQEGQDHE